MLPPSRGRRVRVVLAGAAAVLILVAGVVLSTSAQARQEPVPAADTSVFGRNAKPIERVPANDHARGLNYDGLIAAKTGPCVGGYQVAGVTDHAVCTHGPDPFPAGVDRNTVIRPVPGARRRASRLRPPWPVCEGDGTSGRRVEVLYVHGSTNRYDAVPGDVPHPRRGRRHDLQRERPRDRRRAARPLRHRDGQRRLPSGRARRADRRLGAQRQRLEAAVQRGPGGRATPAPTALYLQFVDVDDRSAASAASRATPARPTPTAPTAARSTAASTAAAGHAGVAAHELGPQPGRREQQRPQRIRLRALRRRVGRHVLQGQREHGHRHRGAPTGPTTSGWTATTTTTTTPTRRPAATWRTTSTSPTTCS